MNIKLITVCVHTFKRLRARAEIIFENKEEYQEYIKKNKDMSLDVDVSSIKEKMDTKTCGGLGCQ